LRDQNGEARPPHDYQPRELSITVHAAGDLVSRKLSDNCQGEKFSSSSSLDRCCGGREVSRQPSNDGILNKGWRKRRRIGFSGGNCGKTLLMSSISPLKLLRSRRPAENPALVRTQQFLIIDNPRAQIRPFRLLCCCAER
jgi:hypothetical protein